MEQNDGDHTPEHAAPPYTIVERRLEGLKVVTTVILDGEVAIFEADWRTVAYCRELVDPPDEPDV